MQALIVMSNTKIFNKYSIATWAHCSFPLREGFLWFWNYLKVVSFECGSRMFATAQEVGRIAGCFRLVTEYLVAWRLYWLIESDIVIICNDGIL